MPINERARRKDTSLLLVDRAADLLDGRELRLVVDERAAAEPLAIDLHVPVRAVALDLAVADRRLGHVGELVGLVDAERDRALRRFGAELRARLRVRDVEIVLRHLEAELAGVDADAARAVVIDLGLCRRLDLPALPRIAAGREID